MTSPFIPCSFSYGDAPQGGSVMPMIIAGRNPSNTTDKQYASGYWWLSDLQQGGSGNLYIQSGNSAGLPNWTNLLAANASGNLSLSGTLGVAGQTTLGALTVVGTTLINATGAATTTIGNTAQAANAVTIAGGSTGGVNLTATKVNLTGNLNFVSVGNKILSANVATTTAAGANSFGTVTLVAGTATVATTSVTANSLIVTWRQAVGSSTALGDITIGTITAGTSFVLYSATVGTPGTPLATDLSSVGWMIIN